MLKITTLSKKSTPLCYLPNGNLVCYRLGDIVVYNNGQKVKTIGIFRDVKAAILGRSRVLSRFLRLGIRCAVAIDSSTIIISVGNYLHEFQINTGLLTEGFFCGDGVRPLTFSVVKQVDGFDDGLYFGGYLRNFEKASVNIYHRIAQDCWEVVYTFPQGSINHVHNVIADPYRKCLWVFSGDFGKAAAIWKCSDRFKKVERFVCNNQKWRSCIAFALPEGILYATDAPFAKNHIYLLHEDGNSEVVAQLPGSCIYGCQWKNKYVFSTVVEADGRNETPLKLLLGWKRGAGITDNYVHMFSGNLRDGFMEIYKEKKDLLPYLFQFGSIRFPAGINNSNTLYFQPVATRENDMTLLGLDFSKE